MKKGVFILLVLLVGISFVSCANCNDDQIIFRLAQEKNSHVGSHTNNNYPVKACHDSFFVKQGNGIRTCNGNNLLFYKSSNENAHVSLSISPDYNIPVCYGNLVCRNTTSVCGEGEKTIARLSSPSNAHVSLGDLDLNYQIRICCKSEKYISKESLTSVKWIGSSSGEKVESVLNNTIVNLSIEGNFDEGDFFDYEIYVLERNSIWGIPLGDKENLVKSGSGRIGSDSNSKNISFTALWEEKFLKDQKTRYVFKIFGEKNELLKRSDVLSVTTDGSDLPSSVVQTRIISPADRSIYLVGEPIRLEWEKVSQGYIEKIKYFSEGSNFNGSGKAFFEADLDEHTLLSEYLFLNYSTSGKKRIFLTTTDSNGKNWTSFVDVSIAKIGLNVFSKINPPLNGSVVVPINNVYGIISYSFNESYVYNYSGSGASKKFTCILGICPDKATNEEIIVSKTAMSEGDKKLNSSDLFFNWSIEKGPTFFLSGNGTSSRGVRFSTFRNPGSEVAVLNLSYLGEKGDDISEYTVRFVEDYCSLEHSSFGTISEEGEFRSNSDVGCNGGQGIDDCCIEDFKCVRGECVTSIDEKERTICSEFETKDLCEEKSPSKLPYANRSLGGICGTVSRNSQNEDVLIANCTCVWEVTEGEEGKCHATYSSVVTGPDPDPIVPGTCSSFSKTTGSCSEGASVMLVDTTSSFAINPNADPDDLSVVEAKEQCINLSENSSIICPTKIRLSFFGVVEMIVSLILVVLIYFVIRDLISRKGEKSDEKTVVKKSNKKVVSNPSKKLVSKKKVKGKAK